MVAAKFRVGWFRFERPWRVRHKGPAPGEMARPRCLVVSWRTYGGGKGRLLGPAFWAVP